MVMLTVPKVTIIIDCCLGCGGAAARAPCLLFVVEISKYQNIELIKIALIKSRMLFRIRFRQTVNLSHKLS
jgi:hypothetical protein